MEHNNTDEMEEFKKQIQNWLEQMQRQGSQMDINQINQHMAQMCNMENTKPRANFNGYSSEQMSKLIYQPLEKGCPVQLRHLTYEEIEKIPFMRQVLHLMNALSQKELKLTPKGNLPIKMVEALYELGSHSWGSDLYSQKTEDRVPEVMLLRAVLKETGLIKVRLGKLSLTEKGKKLLKSDHNELLRTIMLFFFTEFNTGWFDMLQNYEIGNVARLYTLWLLHHYGNVWRDYKFYSEEYFKAFPQLRKETGERFVTCEDRYSFRVFNRFFNMIGLCESKETFNPQEHTSLREVRKTPVLDMMFSFEEPQKV